MKKTVLPLALAALALPLAACAQESGADEKEIGDLRADLQRVRAESDRQKETIAKLERRLNGLSEDMPRSRRVLDEDPAAAPLAPAKGTRKGKEATASAVGTARSMKLRKAWPRETSNASSVAPASSMAAAAERTIIGA